VIRKFACALLGAVILAETAYLVCTYFQHRQSEIFNCTASLVQHYNDEAYNLSLSYMMRGSFGLVHITGRSDIHPDKIINRKVSFKIRRSKDIYHMVSEKNIRLSDDNFSDEELGRYLPHFFVSAGKDIYIRVLKQKNNNLIFMVDSVPTYVCNVNAV